MSRASNAKAALALVGDWTPPTTTKTSATAEASTGKSHYRPLPKEFRRDGFDYRQIYREGDFAIYQQTWKDNEDSAAFEIVRIRTREAFQIGGKCIERAEVYPRSEQWGELGWTVPDKESAFCKLREIVNARKKRIGESREEVADSKY